MTTINKNTNESNIGHETPMDEEYGDEVLCAGWNPQLAAEVENPVAQADKHINLTADLASTDVDSFLKKMYENQS
jgi:hypothetical protein